VSAVSDRQVVERLSKPSVLPGPVLASRRRSGAVHCDPMTRLSRCAPSFAVIAAALSMPLGACGQAAAGRSTCRDVADAALGFEYSLSSPILHVDRRVVIAPGGRAEVELWTSSSMPGRPVDAVGRFGAALPAADVTALGRFARAKGLLAARGRPPRGPQPLTDTFGSMFVLCAGGRVPIVPTPSNEDALGALAERIVAAVAGVADQPVAAVRLSLEGGASGEPLAAVLAHVGTEPLAIVLAEDGDARLRFRLSLKGWAAADAAAGSPAQQPVASVDLPPEAVASSVASGAVPPGVRMLAPGERIRIPLPGLLEQLRAQGGGQARRISVSMMFWHAGPGPARGLVEVDSVATIVAAE
jgi:hypothetical protein